MAQREKSRKSRSQNQERNLAEGPSFVNTLEDVNQAYFERVHGITADSKSGGSSTQAKTALAGYVRLLSKLASLSEWKSYDAVGKRYAVGWKINQGAQFTFFVVNNTSFFDRWQNPEPRTVADNVITLPERTDFYIVSQSVRQGTVSPTALNIVYDTCGLKIDQLLQMLSYKQCHAICTITGPERRGSRRCASMSKASHPRW